MTAVDLKTCMNRIRGKNMANNRIYLKCSKCVETLFLGKTFGDGYYYQNYHDIPLEESLNEFYDEHDICGETCFTIEYECDAEQEKGE